MAACVTSPGVPTPNVAPPERLFVYDSEVQGWHTVPGCGLPYGVDLFTAEGMVWQSWNEDTVLRWVPLLPH